MSILKTVVGLSDKAYNSIHVSLQRIAKKQFKVLIVLQVSIYLIFYFKNIS